MQRRAGSPEYHRDAAARFRLLADIEPWPNLHRHFRQLAAQHEELARTAPRLAPMVSWFGYDTLGRSMLARCVLGVSCSFAIGFACTCCAGMTARSVICRGGARLILTASWFQRSCCNKPGWQW